MIAIINEAKTLKKQLSCDCKGKFNSATCNSNEKCNNHKCQCEFKKQHVFRKDYSWNPSTCICEISRYLKSIADDSVIVFDKIINVADAVSTYVTYTVAANVTSTASINSDNKNVRYKMNCYIL